MILIRMTDEMISDVPLLDTWLQRVASAEFAFRLDEAIISGSAGQPIGLLNSPALITVAKDDNQPAATVSLDNVLNAFARLPPMCQDAPTTRWICHTDVIPQLGRLNFTVGTTILTPSAHIYLPRGAAGPGSPSMLNGVEVITHEACPVLGKPGDLILADLSRYLLIDGGVTPALSAHVAWLTNEWVLRFVLRCDGLTEQVTPVTPFSGSNTQSPYITIAERS